MSKSEGKVAKRYARAIFESLELSQLDQMEQALSSLSKSWLESEQLKVAILNPSLSQNIREQVIRDLANSVRPGDEKLANFLCVISANKRFGSLPEIAKVFSEIVAQVKKLLSIEITSAFALPENEKNEIEGKIRQDVGSSARVQWVTDRKILGGLLIKTGDKLLDASVSGALAKARAQLVG